MDLSEKKNFSYRHPWELSRADMVIKELEKIDICGDILDVGCGDNYFDERLLKESKNINSIWGIDINLKKDIHKKRAHYVNSYDKIEDKKFDYILLMDVIEHIEEPVEFLKNILKYKKENGYIIITVPAFQKLFSAHDRDLKHFRRYEYPSLMNLLNETNITCLNWSYFYLSLYIVRSLTKNKSLGLSDWKYCHRNIKTVIIRNILNIDFTVLRFLSNIGIHINGLSLFMICK